MKLLARAAVCVTLLLCGTSVPARGATDGVPVVTYTPTKKGRESKIHVMLPTAEAKLYFDDTLTEETGKDRKFRSPALVPGVRYKVVVVVAEDTGAIAHETTILFEAGEDVAIDFRR
jgi:uncharacterized protein (TIGR03000 family)